MSVAPELAELGQRAVELGVGVDAARPRRPGGGAGLEDDRVADRCDEVAHLRRAGRARRLRCLDPDGPQRLLHRRLVPAQIRGAHRCPRDAARLAGVRGGHRVRLDRRLERVDPHLALRESHRLDERADVGDVRDLLVVEHPAAQVRVEPVGRTLADPDHIRAGLRETADELALVRRECRFDKDDVHAQILPAAVPTRPRAAVTTLAESSMANAVFVAPFLLPATVRFIAAAASLPGRPPRPDQPGPGGQAPRRPPRRALGALPRRRTAPTRSRSPTRPA